MSTGKLDSEPDHSFRLARRKVKTGCRTCKRRKIKCDERWPVCQRCEAGGWFCSGYGVWGGGSNSHTSDINISNNSNPGKIVSEERTLIRPQNNPAKSIVLVSLATREKEYFEWYLHRSAVKLPGVFVSQEWTSMIVHSSMAEPAIRHALLALASVHQDEVKGYHGGRRKENNDRMVFTTTQYGKAITALRPKFSQAERSSINVALIACSLFIWMEFLRGHYSSGMLHLKSGLELLQQQTMSHDGRGQLGTQGLWIPGPEDWLTHMFTRMLVQARLLGQILKIPDMLLSKFDPLLPISTFTSIHHARHDLESILLKVFDLHDRTRLPERERTIDLSGTSPVQLQAEFRHTLQAWLGAYEKTLAKIPPTNETIVERFAYRLLRLVYYMTLVMVNTCHNPADVMRFDRYELIFLSLITQCVETYTTVIPSLKNDKIRPLFKHDPEASSPNSVSDIGWIGPLYFTAINCRNHLIRHQAIALLQTVLHKEGIWDARWAILVAKKVIEIEEGSFYDAGISSGVSIEAILDNLPKYEDLITAPVLPADLRVKYVQITLPNEPGGDLMVQCHRVKNDGAVECISCVFDCEHDQWRDHSPTTTPESV